MKLKRVRSDGLVFLKDGQLRRGQRNESEEHGPKPQAYGLVVDRLIQDRFLPESARAKYVADAEKVNW